MREHHRQLETLECALDAIEEPVLLRVAHDLRAIPPEKLLNILDTAFQGASQELQRVSPALSSLTTRTRVVGQGHPYACENLFIVWTVVSILRGGPR